MLTLLVHRSHHLLRLFVLSLCLCVHATVWAVDTPNAEKVKAALAGFGEELAKRGKPHAEADRLILGSTTINGDTTVVDAIKARHGCSATIFVRKGDAFVRISTNVMRDGVRAVGSPLDPSGPAYAALSKGKGYRGLVDVLGRMFDAGYEPLLGAKGEVVGAYYVGYALE